MLSKGLAARKGIFALSPAILCYLADIGLMSPPIFQARLAPRAAAFRRRASTKKSQPKTRAASGSKKITARRGTG
jgi:hypothetical protein